MKFKKYAYLSSSPTKLLHYLRNNPCRFVFNFHRVSTKKNPRNNPFSILSNITPSQFEMFMKLTKTFGKFTNLEKLLSENKSQSFRPYFHLTFDDVSTSFIENVLPLIEKHHIPVTLFPSVQNAETGFNWRDKIYYILIHPELISRFVHQTKLFLGKETEINENNIYRWSKKTKCNPRHLEKKTIDKTLKNHMDEFYEKVNFLKPYLNWEELKKLSQHPLITIGNHSYNHYNFANLTEEEIRKDIEKSHYFIKEKIGIKCLQFAVPFGNINQRSFLTVDRILSQLGYKSVGWVKRVNNSWQPKNILNHYFRIDSSSSALINLIKSLKASLKTQYYPLAGIPFSSYNDPQIKVNFTTQVSIPEYKAFFRRIKPQGLHHQNEDYINHLYYKNPYRKEKPVHLALKIDSDIYSIGSLFHVPYILKGEKVEGAYFCGWYRFSQFPSTSLRARKIFEEAQKINPINAAYHPSWNSMEFYKYWDKIQVYRLKTRIEDKKKTPQKIDWVVSRQWNSKLQRIIEDLYKELYITIHRGKDFYNWRIENYPLCDFFYLYLAVDNPEWFIIFCESQNIMYISDFCLSNLQNNNLISEMLSFIQDYAQKNYIQEVQIETSNQLVVKIAKKHRFKMENWFYNVYKHPQAKGKVIPWSEVHETQICGDLLPRPTKSI